MISDPVFYRLFAASPETFFLLLGMAMEDALAMAARYQFEALEFKETSHRLDGVFLPKEQGLPLYFLEIQFYFLPSVFADLLAKAYTYLKRHDPAQLFYGVVLFAERELEPKELAPYQPLLDAGIIRRYYLDEMPELNCASLGLSIIHLIQGAVSEAPALARGLVARADAEIDDAALRADLIQLIETIIIYKLPKFSREEIQAMLLVRDVRETRVYQEAFEEGAEVERAKLQKQVEEERARLQHEKLRSVARMAGLTTDASVIADILDLDIEIVRQELAKRRS